MLSRMPAMSGRPNCRMVPDTATSIWTKVSPTDQMIKVNSSDIAVPPILAGFFVAIRVRRDPGVGHSPQPQCRNTGHGRLYGMAGSSGCARHVHHLCAALPSGSAGVPPACERPGGTPALPGGDSERGAGARCERSKPYEIEMQHGP